MILLSVRSLCNIWRTLMTFINCNITLINQYACNYITGQFSPGGVPHYGGFDFHPSELTPSLCSDLYDNLVGMSFVFFSIFLFMLWNNSLFKKYNVCIQQILKNYLKLYRSIGFKHLQQGLIFYLFYVYNRNLRKR